MHVIQFNRLGPRAPHPLFSVFASLAGMRPGDYVEQVTPSKARLNIDVSAAGDRPVQLDRSGNVLSVKAGGRGPEDILRRIHLRPAVSPERHRRRGDILEIDLSFARDSDPPPTAPAAVPPRRLPFAPAGALAPIAA